jgi:hypothetical protein
LGAEAYRDVLAYRASPASRTPPRATSTHARSTPWNAHDADAFTALFQSTPAQYHGRPEAVEEHTAEIERVRAAGETVC